MKNLAQHIESLIIKHECVIVPGLGGFLTYRDRAVVRNNRLYAPTQRIRFNSLLTHHDGLLAEAYMHDRKIGYQEALETIHTDVEQIKKSLNSGNSVLFGRIGVLAMTENSIALVNSNPSFLPDNMGLPTIHLKQLAATTHNGNTIVLNVPSVSSNALRYVAMLAVIFVISILIPTPVTDATHEASFYKVPSTEYKIETTEAISDNTSLAETANEEAVVDVPTVEIDQPTANIDSRYQLIIASLSTKAEAENYIANNTHFDQSQLCIIESKGKFRISAAGFDKYKEALQYMDSIRTNVPSATKAWILCQ